MGVGISPLVAESPAKLVAPEAVPGVLVLANGNLLQGKIQLESDVYRVRLPQSEVVVRVAQVDMFCHTTDEAYEQRRLQRAGSSADSHVDLARWCLRHDLLEYASRELLEARTIDPEHRQLSQLERQVQLALRNRPAKDRPNPLLETAVQKDEDHSKLIEDVPNWARTLFVRQIQPLLVDSCAASGCHQPGSPEQFQLNRLALDGPGHPATTLNNLAATMAQLECASPDDSVLLLRAKTAHGASNSTRSHALQSHQYHMLRLWVEQLALAQQNSTEKAVELVAHRSTGPLEAPPLIHRALQESEVTPSDPFDADEFNGRFAADDDASQSPATHPESE
jgi:hypothetical protein